ncbi:MAG: phosphatidylglycerophosphatase A [Candidatus Omnitrophota bacterium]
MKNLTKLIVTVFYLGFIPFMPGTIASLAALLIFYFLKTHTVFIFFLTVISGLLGFLFCGKAEKIFKKKDAKFIVIDEFFAMSAVLMLIKPRGFVLLLSFILFRIFDITKLWPIKKIERYSGSRGVMLDDCLAALYTLIITRAIMFF